MTDQADLQALSDAATPGPWVVQEPGDNDPGAGTIYIDTHAYEDGPHPVVTPDYHPSRSDAAYIVALVNAHRETLAASPSPDTDREPSEARVDMFATTLQETGRLTVHPGDEMAALAALRAIGVDTFTVATSPDTDAGLDVDLDKFVPRLSDTHQSLLDVGAILRAIMPRYRLQGLWVQYTGDGTERARHNEVVVGIQYGWPGLAQATDGKGRTVKEATDDLLAQLAGTVR